MPPHTILFIAANPVGTDQRALDEQARVIQLELERTGRRDCFAFETRWAAQPLDLLREMVKHKPAVVHFCSGRVIVGANSAHPAGVYFQAADGRAQLVPPKALAHAFDAAGSVKLVVLDACYSEEHAAAVATYIDCVVGMAGEIIHGAAMSFAVGLYGGLGEGESVATAFKQGCAAIGLTGAGDPSQPQLRVRTGVDASGLVLAERRGATGRERVDADVEREGPLPGGGARQRGIQAAGNVTARDESGVGASQENVRAGGDVTATVTAPPNRGPPQAAMSADPDTPHDLPVGGAHQRQIDAAGNVTARDETGVGVSQQDVHAGEDVYAVVTTLTAAVASRGSAGPAAHVEVSLVNVVAGRDVHVNVPHAPVLAAAAQSPTCGTHTFVGRERELAEIERLLTGADVQLRAALDGLPGIGKTELARQVVARCARDQQFPGGIFWFNAEQTDLRLRWAELVDDPGKVLPDLETRARWAVRQVEQRAQQGEAVLLVLDNVETWEPRPGPLPNAAAIRVLVTTRARWLHNSFRQYEVPPLDLEPARKLLRAIIGHEVKGADELLTVLGGHALSIELAATYLREFGISPAAYLQQLTTGKDLSASVAEQTSYRATARSAFRLLWNRVVPDVRHAWVLAAQLPPSWFSTELAEAIGLDVELRRELVRFHLLDRDARGRYQMHRLLRDFALTEEPPSESLRNAVTQGAAEVLRTGDETLTFQRYLRDADCFAHLVKALANAPIADRLIAECGSALEQLGELPAARQLFEQALASDLKTLGEDHPRVATLRAHLAGVLRDLGDLPAARQLSEQALASDLRTFGEDHSSVARDRSALAAVLQALRELPAARQLFEQALASDLKTFGEDHSDVARDRANLALVLQYLGELPAARQLFEQALASDLRTFGEDHPRVATVRNNLGVALLESRDLSAARQLFEQVLASNLKTFGEDHRDIAMDRNNLAWVFKSLGDLPAARQLFEQALESSLRTLDEDHFMVALYRNNLGVVLYELGNLPAARQLFEQALESDLKTFGENHIAVARDRNNIAWVLWALGKSSHE